MTRINKQFSASKPFRHAAAGLALVAAAGLPAQSQAGWFDQARDAVREKTQSFTAKAAAAPGRARDRIAEVSDKVDEIYSHIEGNRPLADQLRNGRMMNTLKETLVFIQDMQADYQVFADQGVYTFRLEMQDLVADFRSVGETFGRNGAALERLEKAGGLLERMPTSFLYVMHQAVGPQLADLRVRTAMIRDGLSRLPSLPKPRELFRDPAQHAPSICPLVEDERTVASVAALQARIKWITFGLKTIKGYLPDDLVVQADVVAGGGLTMTKYPAQFPFQVMLTIVEAIDLQISNYVTMATAICKFRK